MTKDSDLRPDSFWQSQLNASQWEAVRTCDRPLLVIAGAGSGKTRVLTYKIAYLLEHGYSPHEVLALTFTNKAAREMNERIGQIVGLGKARGLWSGTFHSIFARILRQEAENIGMKRDFTIYDTTDSRSLLKSIIKEMGLNEDTYKPARIHSRISEAKNALLLPQEYAQHRPTIERDQRDNIGETYRIYEQYFQRCRTACAMDFDDLLLYTYLLFTHNEEVRLRYAQRFRYLLVDEYQDTNQAQHTIVKLLTRNKANICVVGDDAQSIYAFRGANIDNILQFTQQYEGAQIVKLEQNYRSTQNIVEAANSIIRHNKEQIEKRVFSDNERGQLIRIMPASSDKEEAAKVIGTLRRLHRSQNVPYDEIAILYRTNAQSRSFEDALREHHLPYRVYGGLSFYQRKEIKDILAYMRLIHNFDDEEAFKRIINYPARGIGATTLQKLFTASREHQVSLWNVAKDNEFYGLQLTKRTSSKLAEFCLFIEELHEQRLTLGAFDLAFSLLERSGLRAELNKEEGVEGEGKRENVEEFLGSIRAYEQEKLEETGHDFTPLADFLQQAALQTDTDQKDDEGPKITLMTMHAAKGLEFDAVFVTGMEDNIFPSAQARLFPRELEEERRLFYVAVTRAKRFCHLSYAKSRYRYGNIEFSEESPFIRNINARFLEEDGSASSSLHEHLTPSLRKLLQSTLGDMTKRSEGSSESRNSPSTSGSQLSHYGGKEADKPSGSSAQLRPSKTLVPPTGQAKTQKPATPTPGSTPPSLKSVPPTPPNGAPHSSTHGQLSVGMQIEHERFGKGIVRQVEGTGQNAKALVDFGAVGSKNLLLKFAKFRILS